jgi:hypothetical protein
MTKRVRVDHLAASAPAATLEREDYQHVFIGDQVERTKG